MSASRHFSDVVVSTVQLLKYDLPITMKDTSKDGWQPLLKSVLKKAARSFVPQKVNPSIKCTQIYVECQDIPWQAPPPELSGILTFPPSTTLVCEIPRCVFPGYPS